MSSLTRCPNALCRVGRVALVAAILLALPAVDLRAGDEDDGAQSPGPPIPVRIDSVVPATKQPAASADSTIWFDDFDEPSRWASYAEKGGTLTEKERFGDTGRALEMHYPKGHRGKGGLKVFFGDSPTYRKQTVRAKERFDDVHWRIYAKHQAGWTGGGPAKLSRATSLVPPGWRQAMIAHVWSMGDALTLDPATGVTDGEVVTRKYNDFEKLRWLGNRPASKFRFHAREESGRWVCVEARARLNTPGKKDGLFQLWIDGRLESERTKLDWHGTFTERGINAVFLEAYWNQGSPVDQSRWIDHFVIATEPIGPVVCPRDPVLLRTPHRGEGRAPKWSVEIAAGDTVARDAAPSDVDVVWRSSPIDDPSRVHVTTKSGSFAGSRRGKKELAPGARHWVRVREDRPKARWTAWHQPFRTVD